MAENTHRDIRRHYVMLRDPLATSITNLNGEIERTSGVENGHLHNARLYLGHAYASMLDAEAAALRSIAEEVQKGIAEVEAARGVES